MAIGDLVTADYMYEFNGFAIGPNTGFDILSIDNLIGHSSKSTTVERFGRHGDTAGRHYAKGKIPTIEGEFYANSDAELETKRRALATAFAPIIDPANKKPLVTQFPGTGTTKVQMNVRPLDLDIPVDRSHAIKNATFKIRFEAPDPILYTLALTTTVFAMPSDTKVLTNSGNAPSVWTASLTGPAENPILTNDDTGQVLSFTSLVLSGSEVLVYDSFSSSIKVNGVSVSNVIAAPFSWFDIDPGANNISFSATNAGSASFSISHRSAYWVP